MQTFKGALQGIENREPPIEVNIQIDGERIRMWSARHRMGSWDASSVRFERQSIFRFLMKVDSEVYAFTPDEPADFAAAVNVEIDLTTADRPRFGLAARLRDVAETG